MKTEPSKNSNTGNTSKGAKSADEWVKKWSDGMEITPESIALSEKMAQEVIKSLRSAKRPK